jgi:RNA polymerase-binding transcription factor
MWKNINGSSIQCGALDDGVARSRERVRMAKPSDLQSTQLKLEELRVSLGERIRNEERKSSASVDANPDRVDLAQDYRTKQRSQAMLDQLRQQLEQVEVALHRLDEGTYGKCAECGRPINAERLQVLPYATLCVRCQSQKDASRT